MEAWKICMTVGLILVMVGLALPVVPLEAVPLEAIGKITTGISIGVTPTSGIESLKVKVVAALFELKNNTWQFLFGKPLYYVIDGVEHYVGLSNRYLTPTYFTLKAGTHEIYAMFKGDDVYAPCTSKKKIVEVSGPYILTIIATEGGTTEPAPGSYEYRQVTEVAIYAKREPTYNFQYWELDGQKIVQSPTVPLIVKMDGSHTVKAVFKQEAPSQTLNYTLTVDKTEVPDVADWRYPVIVQNETVKFKVTFQPYPITQPVRLEVLQAGEWKSVTEFVVVDGEGSVLVVPGLYGDEGDTLTFRVYDPTFKVASNTVDIKLLPQEEQPPPNQDNPPVDVPADVQQNAAGTTDEPQTPFKLRNFWFPPLISGLFLVAVAAFIKKKR